MGDVQIPAAQTELLITVCRVSDKQVSLNSTHVVMTAFLPCGCHGALLRVRTVGVYFWGSDVWSRCCVQEFGESALTQAAFRGHREITRLLIESGANINHQVRTDFHFDSLCTLEFACFLCGAWSSSGRCRFA